MVLIIRWFGRLSQAVALSLLIAACAVRGSADAPQVVATTSVLSDLVSSLGVEVDTLIPAGVDPHDYEMTAREMGDLLAADLVVAFGLGMEEGLEAALDEARDSGVRVLEIGPLVDPLTADGGTFDPHVWTDPIRMSAALAAIGQELSEVAADPDIQDRLTEAQTDLAALDADLREILSGVDNRRLITDHRTLGYFADRYDFEVAGTLIPGTSSLGAPSSRDITELVEVMRSQRIAAIFIEPGGPTDLAETVARQLDFPVEVVEIRIASLGPEGTPSATYRGMMLELARAMAENLE